MVNHSSGLQIARFLVEAEEADPLADMVGVEVGVCVIFVDADPGVPKPGGRTVSAEGRPGNRAGRIVDLDLGGVVADENGDPCDVRPVLPFQNGTVVHEVGDRRWDGLGRIAGIGEIGGVVFLGLLDQILKREVGFLGSPGFPPADWGRRG